MCEERLGEDHAGCPRDCPDCGDGVCEERLGEDHAGCPRDCPDCGDGVCEERLGEDHASCPRDCPDCGDGVCEERLGEDHAGCPADCPDCGDGVCEPELGETAAGCPDDCAGGLANDVCADAEELVPAGEQTTRGTTAGAGIEANSPRDRAGDVWYSFELQRRSEVDVLLNAGGWDSYLFLLSGACFALQEVAHDDDGVAGGSFIGPTQLDPGRYWIVVTGFAAGNEGDFTLTVGFTGLGPVCGDGDCVVGEDHWGCPQDCPHCGDDVCEEALGETHDGCPDDCALCGDEWCQGDLGENRDTCPDDCGFCGDDVCQELSEDSNSCPDDCVGAPENDLCADAIVIPVGGVRSFVGTTLGAVHEGPFGEAPEVFYTFQLVSAGFVTARMEGASDGFDTYLRVASGACGDLTQVAYNDDFGGSTSVSQVEELLLAGRYYVIPTGYGRTSGDFTLTVTFAAGECGNGRCQPDLGETLDSCPGDCRCGNEVCEALIGEDHDTCPADCALCGDRVCEGDLGEDHGNCPADCPRCGDEICEEDLGESHASCPDDCPLCGDGVCDLDLGEDSDSCPADCPICGDGLCSRDLGETHALCGDDCTECGDGACDDATGEDMVLCAADCDGPAANADCGSARELPVRRGEVVVQGSTEGAASIAGRGPTVWFSLALDRPVTVDLLQQADSSHWDTYLILYRGTCDALDTLANDDDHGQLWRSYIEPRELEAGSYLVAASSYSAAHHGGFTLTATFDYPDPCGDGVCEDELGETHDSCPADCALCGDDVCEDALGETPESCPADCHCGDGVCVADLGEDHDTCPADCPLCGDGACEDALGEDHDGCPADCALCGDGVCEEALGEGPDTCAEDCPCGDGACTGDETHLTCPVDCPPPLREGVLTNIPLADLPGWELCYSDEYGDSGTTMASLLADCDGPGLMMACRRVGSDVLTVAAQGLREDVTFDVGRGDFTHTANGVGWYYDDRDSWGFVAAGQSVDRASCDTVNTGAETRLCWHTENASLTGGYRCGATTNLNNSSTWERLVFHSQLAPPLICGDGLCSPERGETPANCPVDCDGACATAEPPEIGDIVVNEALLNPAGNDVNGDGEYGATQEEFVELVNVSGHALDLTGVGLWIDTTGTMQQEHVFELLCLPAANAVVIFGGGAPRLEEPGAIFVEPVRLNLNNTGDRVALRATNGAWLDDQTFAAPNEAKDAWTRLPDGSGELVEHPDLPEPPPVCDADGCPAYSPGRCATGEPLSACLPGADL